MNGDGARVVFDCNVLIQAAASEAVRQLHAFDNLIRGSFASTSVELFFESFVQYSLIQAYEQSIRTSLTARLLHFFDATIYAACTFSQSKMSWNTISRCDSLRIS